MQYLTQHSIARHMPVVQASCNMQHTCYVQDLGSMGSRTLDCRAISWALLAAKAPWEAWVGAKCSVVQYAVALCTVQFTPTQKPTAQY